MQEEQLYNKRKISRAIILDLLRKQEPVDIKSKHVKEYDPPDSLISEEKKKKYTPDLIAWLNGDMMMYEIELGDEPDTDKWRLFDAFAKINEGVFYLVVPDTKKIDVRDTLEDTGISARVLYFDPF